MTGELAPIRRRFGPEDLAPLLAECSVEGTVVVQARADVAETRELLAVADSTDFVFGVVGWVDLTAANVGDTLRELASGTPLVGVRHQVHDEPHPEWLLRPEVQRGLRAVGEAGLAYDFLVRARELPAALETARRLPESRLVIDHLAKPPIRTGERQEWGRALAPFSELENVYCKLSGLVTEADWAAWTPDELAPYVRRAVDWFGPERCMFGSDWPVCLLAADYRGVLDALVYALGDLNDRGRAAILGETARQFYRLPP
jgi:L-fuconolactonase